METLEKHEGLQSRLLKSKSLAVQVKVVGTATAANKGLSSDLAGVVIIAAEDQTASVPAGVTIVAPDDAAGKFSVILDKAAVGEIAKVLQVSVVNITGTSTAAASISGSVANPGYLVIDIDSNVDLNSANCELRLIIDYLKK